jgi:hypothetical protein
VTTRYHLVYYYSPIFGDLFMVNAVQGNIVRYLINWVLLKTREDKNKKFVTYHG